MPLGSGHASFGQARSGVHHTWVITIYSVYLTSALSWPMNVVSLQLHLCSDACSCVNDNNLLPYLILQDLVHTAKPDIHLDSCEHNLMSPD